MYQPKRADTRRFLQFVVPENNKIWEKAAEISNEVLKMEKESFSEMQLPKAQTHTFLAWQKESGKPFGSAINAKYLQVENVACQTFVNRLNRLFVEN